MALEISLETPLELVSFVGVTKLVKASGASCSRILGTFVG